MTYSYFCYTGSFFGEGVAEALHPVPVSAGEVGHLYRCAAVLNGDATQLSQ